MLREYNARERSECFEAREKKIYTQKKNKNPAHKFYNM